MLTVATHQRESDKVVALDEIRRELLLVRTEDYYAQGLRVLLVATRKLDDSALMTPLSTTDEQGLTVEGMLTFLDPPKESARKAITALHDNGVAVKVLDGAIKIPKIRAIEARWHREITGTLKSITLTRSATGKYYAALL